ncbi:hypothetical protein GCM10028798_30500 [Humibacter antri]
MPERIVVADSLGLLSHVPELVGFEPERSLVLITMRGSTTSGTLRVDLPAGAASAARGHAPERRALVEYATTVVAMASRVRGADAVVPIVFTDDSCSAGTPHPELFAQLRSAALCAGLTVRDALFVAADGWGHDGETARHREELDAVWRLRRLDPDCLPVHDPPAREATLPVVDPGEMQRTESALAALRVEKRMPDPVWFAEFSAGWTASAIGPASAALAARVLGEPWSRDVVLFTWLWGRATGRRALRFQERFRSGAVTADEEIAGALVGLGDMPRPSVPGARGGIELLRQVAARLPVTERGACLASLAWLNWALGRGSVAGEYVHAALEADPGYPFARLVEKMLDSGALPEWAFADTETPE